MPEYPQYPPNLPSNEPRAADTLPSPPQGYGTPQVRQDEYDALPPLSEGARVLNTFTAPSHTFADIRRNRSWWLPYVLLVVASLLFAAVVNQRVDADTLAENLMRGNPKQAEKMQNLEPAQRAATLKTIGKVTRYTLYSSPVLYLLFSATFALLLWVGCNFILGGSSTYPEMFSVAMYAALPGVISSLIMAVVVFVGDPETFDIAHPVGTNIGYYLPPDSSYALRTFLSSFDIFTIWQVFLLALGGAIVARVKKSGVLAMAFGVWLLIVLVKTGIAAI